MSGPIGMLMCCLGNPSCGSGIKCRTIMMWRFVPGYSGFDVTINGIEQYTNFADPISWGIGTQYATCTINQATDVLSGVTGFHRTSGVANVEFSGGHGLELNAIQQITVSGVSDSSFDATNVTATAVNDTNLTYANGGTNTTIGPSGTVTILAQSITSQWKYPAGAFGIIPSSQTIYLSNTVEINRTGGITVINRTSFTFNEDGSSTCSVSDVLNPYDMLKLIWDPANPTLGIAALASNFSSITFWDPLSPSDDPLFFHNHTLAWTFNDACVMPGSVIFCGNPNSGMGFFLSGWDTTHASYSGYDGSVISVVVGYPDGAVFSVALSGALVPDTALVTPPGPFCPGYPMAASWILMFGNDINMYQGPGTSWVGAAMSQALFTGDYCFATWIWYSDGSVTFVSCAAGGTGDGVTPIDIPIPSIYDSDAIPSTAYPTQPFTNPFIYPIGKLTCLAPGSC